MNQLNGSSYRVLARAYRPAKLSEVIGQTALVRTLTNGIRTGRLAHAYLLSGIRGVGKTTTARIIARALNCTGPDGQGEPTPEPCGECPSCRAIADDRAVDVIEMDAASHTGKGDVLELMEGVHYAPAAARYKVYIFDEVHMLSEKAWNALLKTIEEPPPHVKFIFATTEIRKVPVTVLSRCQRFELRRVPPEELAGHLRTIADQEGIEVEADALGLIAQSGEGSVRDALSLLDQAVALSDGALTVEHIQEMLGLGDRNRLIELGEHLLGGNAKAAVELFEALYETGADPIAIVSDLLELAHVVSRQQIGLETASSLAATEALRARCAALASTQNLPSIARMWQMLLQGLDEVRLAPDARDAAEMLLLRVASVRDLPSPGDLVRLLEKGQLDVPTKAAPTLSEPQPEPVPVAVGETVVSVAPQAQPKTSPETLDEIVALLKAQSEPILAARLYSSAHLLKLEPGRLQLRLTEDAPKDFANRLGTVLSEILNTRWIVALGTEPGEPTLAERDKARHREQMAHLNADPKLRELMAIFPGASLVDVRPGSTGTDNR